jgi:putative membrane protein
MQTPFRTLALALAATTFAAGAAAQPGQTSPAAQNQMTGQTTGAKKANADLPRADRSFMEKAAQSDQTELQASKLAQSKAADADVKAFAQKTLPTLQQHLKMAQTLHSQVGGKGAAAASR